MEEWHRYFASVSRQIGQRLRDEHFGETSATDLLCQLLDDRYVGVASLEYGLEDLKGDLSRLGEYYVKLTHHKQLGREKKTGADLGITLTKRTIFKSRTQSLLIQAKRLYPRDSGGYSLDCRYQHYKQEQFDALRAGLGTVSASCGFYLLLNPEQASFLDPAAISRSEQPFVTVSHCHQDYSYAQFCPGLRISDLLTIEGACKYSNGSLRSIYQQPVTESSFMTFADFMTQLFQYEVGSDREDVYRLATGETVRSLPGAKYSIEIEVTEGFE